VFRSLKRNISNTKKLTLNRLNARTNSLADLTNMIRNNRSKVDNFKAIYECVEKASSLLRSKSSKRHKSSVKKYEERSKRRKFGSTQLAKELNFKKVMTIHHNI
jgi:hypothetical protein